MNELTEIVEPDIEDLLYEELPEGWSYAKLGQIGKWKGGGTPSKANANYWSGGTIPWVSPKDMKSSRIDDAEDKITEEAVRKSATNLIEAGSILVVTRSGILRSHVPVAMNSVPVTINQDLKALTVNPNYSAEYILQCLLGFNRLLLLQAGKVGTTVESIDFEALKEFAIRVPPFPEQQKIAAILRKWDEGIEKLQKLIAYKVELKRGLMEQLLSGRRRFPEFEGMEWKTVRIGDIARINTAALPESTPPASSFYYIDLSCVKEGHIDFPSNKITFGESSPRARRKLDKGDVLMSTVRPNLKGFALVDFDAQNFICSTGFAVLKPSNPANSAFIYQNLYSKKVENQINGLVTGSNYPAINASDVANLEIDYPTDDRERTRIAAVLSAADLELKGLREELALLRQQKTGLMHRLLTRGTGG